MIKKKDNNGRVMLVPALPLNMIKIFVSSKSETFEHYRWYLTKYSHLLIPIPMSTYMVSYL